MNNNEKIEYVNIPFEISNNIERLFFEYNARLNVCKFLMQQEDIDENIMQKYLDSVECKWVELEMLKQKTAKLYSTTFNKADYEFDFEEARIKYIQKD